MAEHIQITTAWVHQLNERPWLLSAYDEFTFDAWDEEPDWFTKAVKEAKEQGDEVRIVVLSTNYEDIEERFRPSGQVAQVAAEIGSDGGSNG